MEKLRKFLFKNTSAKQAIAKNTLWLFVGEMVGRLLKLIIIVFATRKLGVEGWGVFSYALAYVSFFYFLGDFGINTFLTRELSKDGEARSRYLATATIIKIGMLLAFFAVSLAVGPLFGKIRLGFSMIIVFSTFFVFESLREFAMAINRSMEKMEREGFSKILINTVITVLGIALILKNDTPLSLALAYMAGSIVATIYIFWSVKEQFQGIRWKFSKEHFATIYAFSWPLIILGFFSFIFSIDSIMLGQIKSATEVGLYASCQRLVQFLSIIPTFIAVSTFPLLSKNAADDQKLANIFSKVMIVIMAFALPLTIGGLFFSRSIVLLVLGGAYGAAAPVFAVLIFTVLATFPNILLTNLIFSKNLQRIFITASSVGVLINIILNIFLIPRYGALGAAISTTITCLFIMAINWYKLKKFVPFSVLSRLGKILAANGIMTIVLLLSALTRIHFIVAILAAVMVYAGSLYWLREPSFVEMLALARGKTSS